MSMDFLSAILPTQGKYCVFTLKNGKPFKQIFVDSLENVEATAINFSNQKLNVFQAMATFDETGYREAVHARWMRSLFMDLDCGKEWIPEKVVNDTLREAHWKDKAFLSKRDAVVRLHKFLQDTGLDALGTPWLVDSGGGVHVYWPLQEDAAIEQWRVVAEALKVAAKKFLFPIDSTVTADAARVLRTPGTKNWKYGDPKTVTLRERGTTFVLEDIAALLSAHTAPVRAPVSTALTIPGKRPGGEMSVVAKALAGNSINLFKNIMVRTAKGEGCQQIAHFVDNATEDGMEPLWRGVLSIAKHCDDGVKASRKLSDMHPYDYERMQTKLDAIKGPYTCAALESINLGGCSGCPNQGKITSPIILGRVMQTVTEETVVHFQPAPPSADDEDAPLPPLSYTRPTPPRGFSYGSKGGVFYRKPQDGDAPSEEIMLTSYDFYMTHMFNDGVDFMAEFVAVKNGKLYTFVVPTETLGTPKEITKVLAKNNVIAVGGTAQDLWLSNYVRAFMTEASCSGKQVSVPPHLGWQKNGDFAVGDTVYSSKGRVHDYTYKSKRLHNVIETTTASGTLEGWQDVMHMMINKAASEPIMWGHVSVALTGFASTLMCFAPKGANSAMIHMAGKQTGAGKSLASGLANSVWGDPKDYMVSNKTSTTTLMQRAGLLHSLHLNVDEVTEHLRKGDGDWFPNLVYDYAHGAHKVKGSNAGNAEIIQDCTWAAIGIASSNEPQAEAMLGARKHTSFGEIQRMIEWKFPRTWSIEWTPEERDTLQQLQHNYGTAGRKWIMWYQAHKEEAENMYRHVEKSWREKTGADDNERFWTALAVAEITAAILVGPKYANILRVPVTPIFDFWFSSVRYMRKTIRSNLVTAIDILNSYTREYSSNFVQIDCGANTHLSLSHLAPPATPSKAAVRGRIEREIAPGVTDYYIEIKLLKVHCASIGHSYNDFKRELEMDKTVAVVSGRKDLLAHTSGPSMRVPCLKITMSTVDADRFDKD